MSIQITTFRLTNYRCFREAEVAFHPKLTVLAADNGMGKTALLDAVAVGLAEFVDVVCEFRQSSGIDAIDIRSEILDQSTKSFTSLEVDAQIRVSDIHWSVKRSSTSTRMNRSSKSLQRLVEAAVCFRDWSQQEIEAEPLPVVAYYSSTRFSPGSYFGTKSRKKVQHLDDCRDGYADYLNPLSDANRFNEWYSIRVSSISKRTATGSSSGAVYLAQISAVRKAVATVLEPTGWTAIDWDNDQQCVVVEHKEKGRMPLAWLSSGIRSMVALVSDIAYRCATLNPAFGEDAAEKSPGIVLIDEIDLHLHPSWQQQVVGLIQSAFPEVQFILTTHSPQVLSTVDVESIRVIHHGETGSYVDQPKLQTRGVESADVLSTIMDVDPIPQVAEAIDLQQYRNIIERGEADNSEGQNLRAKLLDHFGLNHPLMLDCERLARLVAFKRNKSGGTS